MEKVWVLDIGEGAERAFLSLEAAYQAAYDYLINWGYDPESENEKELFKEMKESYENDNYSGFAVDEVLWCWEVPLS